MAWLYDKKIDGLYSYGPQNRNSWIHVVGLGWKLLWGDHDCQSEAMTIMLSHARSENRNVNLEEENGTIKTLYVW
ncbi:hypothetical protein [Thiocystis violascens]|uniref:Uncharacterized protein n=1 Tax=Thiocystis violascens (strain ATCC 17096 / DSM 198 / 6111) TaxID=765911 RepID=I3YEZ3_THIV6|nr:hypothetical protein [Thiocystis violascens]AFL75561.1 hypothetical protein Thivi_3713 [Thiocystis violascens DSM 198]